MLLNLILIGIIFLRKKQFKVYIWNKEGSSTFNNLYTSSYTNKMASKDID
jgi:hypothetical protein